MTPLNSIMTNSKIAYRRFLDICEEQQAWFEDDNDSDNQAAEAKNIETLTILRGI